MVNADNDLHMKISVKIRCSFECPLWEDCENHFRYEHSAPAPSKGVWMTWRIFEDAANSDCSNAWCSGVSLAVESIELLLETGEKETDPNLNNVFIHESI